LNPISVGAVAVLRAIKLKPSREKMYPDAALMVKNTAFFAAEWFVGDEKNPAAPLICAALSQPELDVNELKVDSLESEETIMPGIDDAELNSDPPVKLKFARVAACAVVKPNMHARHSLPRGG
jgi:hypothetical protein